MEVELGRVLRAVEDATWELIERAMRDGATLADVAAATVAVRATGALRRKYAASSPAHGDIEAEFLTCLSLRLMEIDGGDDLGASRAVAELIAAGRKQIPTD